MPLDPKKLLDDVEKTGFPLELRVASALVDHGYLVEHNVYYVDQDEQKGREIEISALKNSQNVERSAVPGWVRHRLLVECKKSSTRPWVIFTSPATRYDSELTHLKQSGLNPSALLTETDLELVISRHPFWQMPRRGRSYYEAFRNKNDDAASDTIFRALTTTVKATIATMATVGPGGGTVRGDVSFYYPLVVLDGELYEGYLGSQQQIELVAQPCIPISFRYESAKYPKGRFTVPVVQEGYLGRFLGYLDGVLEQWLVILERHKQCVLRKL